jgi:hypothetical protein
MNFPRGHWLERRILKMMNNFGFQVPPRAAIETYFIAFLSLAHQQCKLDRDVKDKAKVRLFFAHLLFDHTAVVGVHACLKRAAHLHKITRALNAERDNLVVAEAEEELAQALFDDDA